jgi:alpha-glucosidase
VLLLTLRGTPFLFQGEELGLLDAIIPPDRSVDPGGRDGCRAPIPWNGSSDHGWPTAQGARTWLPFPPETDVRNHEDQREDPSSILHLYRRLLALRRCTPALATGGFDLLEDAAEGLLAYRRTSGDQVWTVLVNFTDQAVHHAGGPSADTGLRVVVSSDGGGEGGLFGGTVGGDQAVVLTG